MATNFNALNLVDPASAVDQTNNTFLVDPTSSDLGDNLNAITALPASGEVVSLSNNGWLTAVDGNGTKRWIVPPTLWPDTTLPGPIAAALATDPVTGRIWVAYDVLDEIWSLAADTGADQKEIAFPLTNPSRPDRQIDFHDPGMAFSPNGSFLVLTDTSTSSGAGGVYVFHNETLTTPDFQITQFSRSGQNFSLTWQSAGAVKYRVQRSSDLGNSTGFTDISGDLTATSFTDTNAPAGAVFYRVMAKP